MELNSAEHASRTSPLRLADFIRQNQQSIVKEWTDFAQTCSPASLRMTKLRLQDHIIDILVFITADLETAQTPAEQFAKSRGNSPEVDRPRSAAEVHAALRLIDGFDIDQMVSEYRALRASVIKQWVANNRVLASADLEDLTRFNESIDQALSESVAHYTKTINDSRNLFLGVLGHDLRNPIGAASMAAKWMVRMGMQDAKQAKAASEIVRVTGRATEILDDLLDLARSAFGTDLTVKRAEMDIVELCHQLAAEMRSIRPDRDIIVHAKDPISGNWDKSRIGQVLSNVMANAIQYSSPTETVSVEVFGTDSKNVEVTVHNHGEAIPPEKINTIFQSWMRGQSVEGTSDAGTHLGLGLYISKLIIEAHGGKIGVTSESTEGTTFRLSLPRQ